MPGRVLVRLPNWLGDLLMARPLLHALRASAAEVWAVGTEASRLLERERLWDRWCTPVEAARGGGGASPQAGGRFETALILPPSFSSAWRLRGRAARRIGFAAGGRSWLLTDALRRPARGDTHLSEEYLRLGGRIGLRRVEPGTLRPTSEEEAGARARLGRIGADGVPLAILGPGAAYGPAKRWAPERYVALGRRFIAEGFAVLVCGAAEDRAIAAPIAEAIGVGAHALAGETTLAEQLALCAAARVTVSNDSGLAHLAAASGAPTVVIFGSTSSAWTAPLGPRVRVVQRAPVCSPCFQRSCRIGYRCLEAIGVEEVAGACAGVAA